MIEGLFVTTCIISLLIGGLTCFGSIIYDTRRMRQRTQTKKIDTTAIYTISGLQQVLRDCLTMPFIKTARLLGIRPAFTRRQRQRKRVIFLILTAYRLLLGIAIGYAAFLAIVHSIDEPIFIIGVGFTAYFIVCVMLLAALTFQKRLYILCLAPVALWYSLFLLVKAILKILTNMAKAVFPISVSLFMRVKNILRVV